jgi:hypothetical protein
MLPNGPVPDPLLGDTDPLLPPAAGNLSGGWGHAPCGPS